MNTVELLLFTLVPTLMLGLVIFALREEFSRNRLAVAALAAMCVLFFHRLVFFGEALSQSDANLLQLKFFSVYADAILAHGQVPFWNPAEGAGVPNLAHPLSAMFYPLTPLFLAGDPFAAMNAFVVIHYFLAAVFALFLGTRLLHSRSGAFAFAILYAFNGWAVTRAAHQPAIEYLFAYAWLPLAAYAFERAIEGARTPLMVAVAGASIAWMGMAAPNLFVYGMLVLAAALALRALALAAQGRRNTLLAAAAVAVSSLAFALALGAVEYLPARELARYSTVGRFGLRLPEDWRGRALEPLAMLRLYFPYVTSRPFGVYYSPGILALAAAAFGFYHSLASRRRRNLALSCVAVLAFGASLLMRTPVYAFLTRLSDTFARSSLIPSALIFLVLPVILLAGLGVDALVERAPRRLPRAGILAALLVFAELFVGLAVIYPRRGDRRLTMDAAAEVADFPHLDEIAARGDAGRILLTAPGELLAPPYATMPRGLRRLNLDPAGFAPDWLARIASDLAREIDRDTLDALGVGWVASATRVRGLEPAIVVPWPGIAAHDENSISFPLRNEPYWIAWDRSVRLYRMSETPVIVRGEPLSRASIITGASETPLGELMALEVSTFAGWDPIHTAFVSPNRLTVVLPDSAPVRYFFAVTAYPGWRFFADAREVDYAVAGQGFMAVDVPPGTSTIEARFTPTWWRESMALALAAFFFTVGAAGGRFRRSRPPDAAAS